MNIEQNCEINQQLDTADIVTSTGKSGVSRRSYNRLYVNGNHISDDFSQMERNYGRLVEISERHREKISRVVFRGIASEEVVEEIVNSDLSQQVEVAFPLHEFTNDSSWFLYLANNNTERREIIPIQRMIEETETYRTSSLSPLERVQRISQEGYRYRDRFSIDQIEQVYDLWGETFGWERNQVRNLRMRIDASCRQEGRNREVWFTGIEDSDGQLVSCAMAERLQLPGNRPLEIVESTEWRTRTGNEGRGFMTATLSLLNAQILSDIREMDPLIYAECNFQAHSDRAGFPAGFRVPSREIAPQILVQNVMVQDDTEIDEGKLRDFTFMFVPKEVIEKYYSLDQTDTMMNILQS